MDSTNEGARLIRQHARVLTERFDLSNLNTGELCVIGRALECQIVIDENEVDVSRQHATIQRYGDGFTLRPYRREKIVYVNGILLPFDYPKKLINQDKIALTSPIDTFLIFIDPTQKESAIAFDPLTITLRMNGQPIDLSGKEFELYLYLSRRIGQLVSNTELIQAVWNENNADTDDRAVNRLHKTASRLRIQLEKYTRKIEIKNLRGQGYQLIEHNDADQQ